MKQLITAVEDSEKNPLLDIAKQNEFLETTIKILKNLYETNPTDLQKKEFDFINALLQEYASTQTISLNRQYHHFIFFRLDLQCKLFLRSRDGGKHLIFSIKKCAIQSSARLCFKELFKKFHPIEHVVFT